jgi:hypothetical protein
MILEMNVVKLAVIAAGIILAGFLNPLTRRDMRNLFHSLVDDLTVLWIQPKEQEFVSRLASLLFALVYSIFFFGITLLCAVLASFGWYYWTAEKSEKST